MKHISFVILQYNTYELTMSCVQSIIKNIRDGNYSVVIVDNASTNNAAEKISEYIEFNQYQGKVILLKSAENGGFAKGNNIGYRYAVNKLQSDYVVCINNDTEIYQEDFISKIEQIYKENKVAVIGPDIVTIDNRHQNPYRENGVTRKKAKNWKNKRFIWLMLLYCIRLFPRKISGILYNAVSRKKISMDKSCQMYNDNKHKDVVLHGACMIFTPEYINTMKYAFCPYTFLYCEEDILFRILKKKKMHTLYTSGLKIIHKDGRTSASLGSTSLDKEIFETRNIIKSLKVLIRLCDM